MGAVTFVSRLEFDRFGAIASAFRARVGPPFGDCQLLGRDLGLREQWLLEVVPRLDGACLSSECPLRSHCPLHPAGQQEWNGESFQSDFQQAVGELREASTLLGRQAEWHHFRNWFALEQAEDGWSWSEQTCRDWQAREPLLSLLLRASKRGAALGHGGGGSGEGLLGWLDEQETSALVARLEGYPLDGEAPAGLADLDPFLSHHYLPELRLVMVRLRDFAAAAEGRGLILTRQ